MNKQIILFDLDDVLVKGGFLSIANQVFGDSKKEEEISSYYVEENFNVTDKQKEIFLDELTKRNVYEHAIIIDGAYDILKKCVEDESLEVFIKSASVIHRREDLSGKLFLDKYNLIRKVFPFIPPNNIILGGNTSILHANYFVDDKIENLQKSKVEHKFLFTAYHNLGITDDELARNGIIRVNSHTQLNHILSRIRAKII